MILYYLLSLFLLIAALYWWYRQTTVLEGDATVHLQSEHEHFHMHVDLPRHMEIQPGDTLNILSMPKLEMGHTVGEISFPSRVQLTKASWLNRFLVKNSSLMEVVELVDHP